MPSISVFGFACDVDSVELGAEAERRGEWRAANRKSQRPILVPQGLPVLLLAPVDRSRDRLSWDPVPALAVARLGLV